jgi:hypothetical protein
MQVPLPKGLRTAALWAVILAVAVGFRVWGLGWGDGRIDLNPDENMILDFASKITWADPNPHFYNYCGFIFHLSFLTTEALKLGGVTLSDWDRLIMHRLWSVFWGVGTVVLVYHLARRLGQSRRTSFIGAGLMAILPLHVWESHFGTTDTPLLFWLMASFFVSVLAYEQPTWFRTVLAGVLTGFATGTKYPGAFGVVPFVTAVTLATREGRLESPQDAARRVAGFAAGAIAGSFLVSPYSYIGAVETANTFLFEYDTVRTGHFGFDLNVPGWQYHRYIYELAAGFPFAFGLPLFLVILASVVPFALKADGPRLLPLVYLAVFFGATGSWVFVPIRYFMPLFPILIIVGAWGFDRLLTWRPVLGAAVLVAVVGYTTAFTASTTHRFTDDTRVQAARWANQWLRPNSAVLTVHSRLRAYVPRLDPAKFDISDMSLRRLNLAIDDARNRQQAPGNSGVVYLVASGLDFVRYYRTSLPDSVQAWDTVRNNPKVFRKVKSFHAPFLNRPFYESLDPMFGSYFVSPDIEFYEYLGPGAGAQEKTIN